MTLDGDDRLLGLLLRRPEMLDVVKAIIRFEEEKGLGDKPRDVENSWQWFEVRSYPRHLHMLVVAGAIDIVFHSRKFTHYRVHDLAGLKEAVGRIEQDWVVGDVE